jgi:hypothetical protein
VNIEGRLKEREEVEGVQEGAPEIKIVTAKE